MVCIQSRQTALGIDENNVLAVLDLVREELDDHREAINEGANETQATFQFVQLLNDKIERLAERVDELTLLVKGKRERPEFNITPLNGREKELFLVLYTITEAKTYATYREIARKLAWSESLVGSYVTNLIEKGVPVLKKYADGTVYLRLEEDFRREQARNNIVGVDSRLTRWIQK